jgi:hypothetical protein
MDSQMCEAAGQHKAATRHTPDECPVNTPTFDSIAEIQGWNADSREQVLRSYIDSDMTLSLAQFARNVADEENGVEHGGKAVPDFQMDVRGEYQGNAYPETAEYRVRIVQDRTDQMVMSVEDSGGHLVGSPLDLDEALIDGIRSMASTDHSLSAYEDDWDIPAGMDRHLTWLLQTDLDHCVVLDESRIDHIVDWLDYADGTKTWDWAEQGEEWL